MELIIASNNEDKVREIREIIADKFDAVYSLADKDIKVTIDENADTFLGNALIKAEAIGALTGAAVLADDSGLVVEALGGAPGIYSARYAGENSSSAANNKLLLENMRGVKDRSAYFTAVVVLRYPDGNYVYGEGNVYGYILEEARGAGGFGYDPLFFSNELNKSFAEADSAEKNAISHRGRALHELLGKL